MTLTGADIITETLIEQNVDTVFGYPGGAVLNIYDSLYKYQDKIKHYLTSHEQHAGHAADGYARSTGKTGVVIATSGPGASNLITAIATAQMDSVPMVVITGNVNLDLLGLDSFQEVDITGMTMPVTKHNFVVRDITKLADIIRKAFFIARDGRCGVVLIDVPKDITAQTCEWERAETAPAYKSKRTPVDHSRVDRAVELFVQSSRPYVYTGGGIISANAAKEAAEFVKVLNAPVSSSLMGQGGFDQTDERYIGLLGMHGSKAAAETIKNCDLFVALGTRFSDRVTGDTSVFAKDAKVVHVDIDAVEHGKNIDSYLDVVGDLKEVLSEVNKRLKYAIVAGKFERAKNDWVRQSVELNRKYDFPQEGTAEFPVTPQRVLEELCRITKSDIIITTEVGQSQMWAAQYYRYRTPRSFITSGGLGTMGFGLGAAIGSKIGNPAKTVVNIAGDGSFGMNMNELLTLARYKIPVIQLVMNNGTLGMVRQWQKLFYGQRYSQTTLGSYFDYMKLGGAFGIKSFVIKDTKDIAEVLENAVSIAKNEPVLIECRIDIDLNVLPMVPAGKPITEPMLSINGER